MKLLDNVYLTNGRALPGAAAGQRANKKEKKLEQ